MNKASNPAASSPVSPLSSASSFRSDTTQSLTSRPTGGASAAAGLTVTDQVEVTMTDLPASAVQTPLEMDHAQAPGQRAAHAAKLKFTGSDRFIRELRKR